MDQDIAVTTKRSSRIYAFDIIRGFFLIVILINHIEMYPNLFDLFTGRGRLLVSAAEGFFFMSGVLVGMVYRRRLALGMRFIFKKMWTRALELYIGSIILTLLFTWAAIYFKHTNIKDGIPAVINWPHIVKEAVLMRYGYGWADFLDRFAILMFLAPFAFYLISRGRWWLLMIVSVIAWAWPGDGFTLHWQIIYALGMIMGYHWSEIRSKLSSFSAPTKKRLKLSLAVITAVSFSLSYASVYILSVLNEKFSGLPLWLQHLTLHWNSANEYVWRYAQKWTVGPLRLILFLIWFSVLFMLVERYQTKINRYTRSVIQTIGQNSLFVYIAHSFIVFIFKLFIAPGKPLFANFLVTAGALASLIVVTTLYTRLPSRRAKHSQLAGGHMQSRASHPG